MMTAQELIAALKKHPPNTVVLVENTREDSNEMASKVLSDERTPEGVVGLLITW